MSGHTLHIDIAIIGGGIAGLWTLNQLRNRGYSAVLFEQLALGSEQTIGSQGMIHGGVKYALAGTWGGDSRLIATMPAIWRQCLAGQGKVDLRGCRVLSEDFYLWSGAGLRSRLSTLLASKLLHGQVQELGTADYPEPLRDEHFRGRVYRLADLVLDVPSLVATLARQQHDAIFNIDWQQAALHRRGDTAALELPDCTVRPRCLLLTAGAGNEALIANLGAGAPAMQRRPLQQVLVKHQYPGNFYGHCIGHASEPRLTVSSHRCADGQPLWYLGGELATAGADEDPARLLERARAELAGLLPWVNLGPSQWRSVRFDRAEPHPAEPHPAEPRPAEPQPAEPRQAGIRPDSAFVGRVEGVDNALAAWPTKLTLAPHLADQVERQLAAAGVRPGRQPDLAVLAPLGRPAIAKPCWDTLFQCPG